MRVSIVGTGPGDSGFLTPLARQAIASADALIGAARLVQEAAALSNAECFSLVKTPQIVELLSAHPEWQHACVVMSGDVGLFSGAKGLRAALGGDARFQIDEIPGVSSAQLLAARLGRPWQDWRFESAHGVACNIEALAALPQPLFLVTGGQNTVGALCGRLAKAGMGDVRVCVGERLSYEDERISCGSASEFAGRDFDSLSVMLVEPAGAERLWPWSTGGIPDELFERGSAPMTKQEVRAVALAKLRVRSDDTLYDVGAGTGSVTVEMALAASQGKVIAFERDEEGVKLTQRNVRRFGVGNVEVVAGQAPDAFQGKDAPDAVFVGGSGGSLKDILDAVCAANPAVRVCVTCVTLETLAQAQELLTAERFTDFDAVCVSVSRATKAGAYHLMRALNPVHILAARGVASAEGPRP